MLAKDDSHIMNNPAPEDFTSNALFLSLAACSRVKGILSIDDIPLLRGE